MPRFPVSEAKQKDLEDRLQRLGISEADLDEQFTHAGGAGGQKVNKTSVAVQVSHRPSGMMVCCTESRSQAMNRFLARRQLVEKMEEKILQEKSERVQKIEKLRRQKRKRSKRAKQKMLDNKKHQSSKKHSRSKAHFND